VAEARDEVGVAADGDAHAFRHLADERCEEVYVFREDGRVLHLRRHASAHEESARRRDAGSNDDEDDVGGGGRG